MSSYRTNPPIRVLLDLDGCLVDLVSVWLDAYNEATGEAITPSDVTSYKWGSLVKNPEVFYRLLGERPLFANAAPFRSIEGFKRLCADERFDVHVVSYVHESAWETGFQQKLAWLAEHCPYFDRSKVTFTQQKHIASADVLIEDSPENIDAWTTANPKGHAIVIRAAYNANWRPKHSRRVTMANDVTEAVSAIFRSYT